VRRKYLALSGRLNAARHGWPLMFTPGHDLSSPCTAGDTYPLLSTQATACDRQKLLFSDCTWLDRLGWDIPRRMGISTLFFGHDLLGCVFNTAPVCLTPRLHGHNLLGRVPNTANGPKLGIFTTKNGDLPMGISPYEGRSSHKWLAPGKSVPDFTIQSSPLQSIPDHGSSMFVTSSNPQSHFDTPTLPKTPPATARHSQTLQDTPHESGIPRNTLNQPQHFKFLACDLVWIERFQRRSTGVEVWRFSGSTLAFWVQGSLQRLVDSAFFGLENNHCMPKCDRRCKSTGSRSPRLGVSFEDTAVERLWHIENSQVQMKQSGDEISKWGSIR